jgi:type II secretory pathway pseudopilin PulG
MEVVQRRRRQQQLVEQLQQQQQAAAAVRIGAGTTAAAAAAAGALSAQPAPPLVRHGSSSGTLAGVKRGPPLLRCGDSDLMQMMDQVDVEQLLAGAAATEHKQPPAAATPAAAAAAEGGAEVDADLLLELLESYLHQAEGAQQASAAQAQQHQPQQQAQEAAEPAPRSSPATLRAQPSDGGMSGQLECLHFDQQGDVVMTQGPALAAAAAAASAAAAAQAKAQRGQGPVAPSQLLRQQPGLATQQSLGAHLMAELLAAQQQAQQQQAQQQQAQQQQAQAQAQGQQGTAPGDKATPLPRLSGTPGGSSTLSNSLLVDVLCPGWRPGSRQWWAELQDSSSDLPHANA